MDISGLPIPLKRTGGAIDRLIALPIEAMGDWVEKRLKANVDAHIEEVTKVRKRQGKRTEVDEKKLSIERVKSIHEWARRAAEVDPEDKVLSAAWRAALDRLLDEDENCDELLELLLSLPKSTVRYFFEHYGPGIRGLSAVYTDNPEIERLNQAGLLKPLLPRWVLMVGVGLLALSVLQLLSANVSNRAIYVSIISGLGMILYFTAKTYLPSSGSGIGLLKRYDKYRSQSGPQTSTREL